MVTRDRTCVKCGLTQRAVSLKLHAGQLTTFNGFMSKIIERVVGKRRLNDLRVANDLLDAWLPTDVPEAFDRNSYAACLVYYVLAYI